MPTRTNAKQKTAALAHGLTTEERDELLRELTANPASATARAELPPRERLIGSLLKERNHLDGCPVITDELGGLRCEAYDETKPAIPSKGEPAHNVAVLRCLECGGTQYVHKKTVAEVLSEALQDEAEDGELDGSI